MNKTQFDMPFDKDWFQNPSLYKEFNFDAVIAKMNVINEALYGVKPFVERDEDCDEDTDKGQ